VGLCRAGQIVGSGAKSLSLEVATMWLCGWGVATERRERGSCMASDETQAPLAQSYPQTIIVVHSIGAVIHKDNATGTAHCRGLL
jgi:hypothetical protein